jgi:hypothetical protein
MGVVMPAVVEQGSDELPEQEIVELSQLELEKVGAALLDPGVIVIEK